MKAAYIKKHSREIFFWPTCPTYFPDRPEVPSTFQLTYPTICPTPTYLIHPPTQITSQNWQITSLNPQITFHDRDSTMLTKFHNVDQISQFWPNFTISTIYIAECWMTYWKLSAIRIAWTNTHILMSTLLDDCDKCNARSCPTKGWWPVMLIANKWTFWNV